MSASQLLGLRCKGNEKFANVQIFLKKVYGLKFIVKEFTRKGYVKPPKNATSIFRTPAD